MDPNIIQPVQPQTPPVQTPLMQGNHFTSKKKWVLVMGIVIFLLFLGTGFYLIRNRGNKPNQNTISLFNTIPTPTPRNSTAKVQNVLPNTNCNNPQKNIVTFTRSGDIWIANMDGTCGKKLTDYGLNFDPVLSPTQDYVAYYSLDEKLKANADTLSASNFTGINIWVIDIRTGKSIKLTESNLTAHRTSLSWSPDGKTILYDEDGKVILVNPDGTNVKVLVNLSNISGTVSVDKQSNSELDYAKWSPDGSEIAAQVYTRAPSGEGDGGNYELLLYDLNGKLLNEYPNVQLSYWSKLDNRLYHAYSTNGLGIYNLWSEAIDGTNQKLISGEMTLGGKSEPSTNSAIFGASEISISPDGKTVATIKDLDFNQKTNMMDTEIWLMNIDGTNSHKLIQVTPVEGINSLEWTPDGSKILLRVLGNSMAGLYSINPDGSNLTVIDPYHSYTRSSVAILSIKEDEFSTGVKPFY